MKLVPNVGPEPSTPRRQGAHALPSLGGTAAFLMPLLGVQLLNPPVPQPLFSTQAVIIVWLTLRVLAGRVAFAREATAKALPLIAFAAASLLWTPPHTYWTTVTAYALVVGLALLVYDSWRRLGPNGIVAGWILGNTVVALLTILEWRAGQPIVTREFGPLPAHLLYADARYAPPGLDPNFAAVNLVVATAFCFVGLKMFRPPLARALAVTAVPVLGAALVLTGSRGALVSGVCVFLVVTQRYWKASGRHRVARRLTLGCTSLLGLGSIWALATSGEAFTRTGVDRARFDVWQRALDLWLDAPVVGHGLGSMATMAEARFGEAQVAHNTALEMLVELGVIGLVLAIPLTVMAVQRAAHLYATAGPDALCRLVVVAAVIPAALSLSIQTKPVTVLLVVAISLPVRSRLLGTKGPPAEARVSSGLATERG